MALGRPNQQDLLLQHAIKAASGIVRDKQVSEAEARKNFKASIDNLIKDKQLLTFSQYTTVLSLLPAAIIVESEEDNLVDRIVDFLNQPQHWKDNDTYESLRNYSKTCAAIVKNYQRREAEADPQHILAWLEEAIKSGSKGK